ncbi:LysR family transcriptional regulator [Alicycliphilus denitrificans]|uniref:Transcriptional regulator, LysR family n=2 Tax=Alicycliphilus denitrificans TaxID=179636 RepID=F4G9K0_ALIDK|nr:LysR family transcriptional regulator [Alicycliphilus denitrificans]AEB83415.1 transcriptional regulator, LysR family [Alicycliphilus denitrificans K601]QKD45295.1 LysR family transcriptional regulator [Alicycliphilus denitrificans]
MDEHRLKCFVAVYEQGSVSAAATRLHMTQPPLSILLRKLEDELGVTLFDRSGHRLAPTATGELFYLRAKALLANLQTMRRELREAEQGARGSVHIGCATAASLFVMPGVMEDLRSSGLDITVHVQEGETGYMLQRLRERSLDLVISRSEYIAPELETRIIMDEPLQVALPPDHPQAGCDRVRLEDLRHDRFLLHRSPLGAGISDMVLRACQQAGVVPNVVYWGGETLPMLLMAQKGLGVAFAPQSFGQLAAAGLPRLVPLAGAQLRTHLNVVWPRQLVLTPAASRIRDLILERFAP